MDIPSPAHSQTNIPSVLLFTWDLIQRIKRRKERMGCVQSTSNDLQAKARVNEEIDDQIERDRFEPRKEIIALVLGAEQSGKSTMMEHLRLLGFRGYSNSERESYKSNILSNTVRSMRAILRVLPELDLSVAPANKMHRKTILRLPPKIEGNTIPPDVSDAIRQLWCDPSIQNAVTVAHKFRPDGAVVYYLNSIDRILSPSYLPTDQDIQTSTTMAGMEVTMFSIGELTYRFLAPSTLRCEQREWIHRFENIPVLVYVVGLGDYDNNRMHETLTHFDSICNAKWFVKTSIILFLNKIDLFAEKLPHFPLADVFPDYTGGSNYDAACDYVLHRFVSLNRSPATRQIYAHYTSADDPQQIKVILSAVQDILLQADLRARKLI